MAFSKDNTIFLYHYTMKKKLQSIKDAGELRVKTSENPMEQLLEYHRTKYFPNKPTRHQSVFFAFSLNTFLQYDFLGSRNVVLVLFFPYLSYNEDDPDDPVYSIFQYEPYVYSHANLVYLWNDVSRIIRRMYPETMAESSVVLTEKDIEYLYEADENMGLSYRLNDFWKEVNSLNPDEKIPTYHKAMYCKKPIKLEYNVQLYLDVSKR